MSRFTEGIGRKYIARERSQITRQNITDACNRVGLRQHSLEIGLKKILFLREGEEEIGEDVLKEVASVEIQKFMGRTSCSHTSKLAIDSGVASGALTNSRETRTGIIVHGFHVINYRVMPDGTFLAFDLTAGSHLDHGQGNFDILIFQGKTLEDLVTKSTHLYAGKWETVDSKGLEY